MLLNDVCMKFFAVFLLCMQLDMEIGHNYMWLHVDNFDPKKAADFFWDEMLI
jgi:hypothetical protein